MRVHSFAVWTSVVFLLNVAAFLLMGMQAHTIVAAMSPERLREAAGFAALVIAAVVGVRLAWVLIYIRLSRRFQVLRGGLEAATWRQGLLVGWCGMRGLVTLATAFALPADFPERDLIVLAAFAVVLVTLVLQGLTLSPLIHWLGLSVGEDPEVELNRARKALADAALASLAAESGPVADEARHRFEVDRTGLEGNCSVYNERQRLELAAHAAQRDRLRQLLDEDAIGQEEYEQLQEELDWRDLAIGPDGRRLIEQG
jgi:CPA1 family monovalent cation:H+ antiporter